MTKPEQNVAIRATIFSLAGLCLLTLITFSSVRHFTFLNLDDHQFVQSNPHIRDGLSVAGIKWAFTADLITDSNHADYWQPVTFISRMLDVTLFGMQPAGHHMMNLMLHIINGLLVFWVVHGLTGRRWTSVLCAGVFLLHPLQVEVVAWITARKDLLSTFFALLLIKTVMPERTNLSMQPKRTFWHATVWPCLLYGLALMAKPTMIMLPLLIMALDYRPSAVDTRRLWLQHARAIVMRRWPLLLITLLYLPLPLIGQPRALGYYSLTEKLGNGLVAYAFYLQKFICPTNLGLYGPAPLHAAPWIQVMLALILITGITTLILRARSRVQSIGWIWFLLLLIPALTIRWPADRFMYLPLVGLILIVSDMLPSRLWDHKRWAMLLTIAGLGVLAGVSYQTVAHWKDSTAVMQRALQLNPANYLAHNNLALELNRVGKNQEAVAHYLEAISIEPNFVQPYNNLGHILNLAGQPQQAVKIFERGLAIKPDHVSMLSNCGAAYFALKDNKKALSYFERALNVDPTYKPALWNARLLKEKDKSL